MATAPAPQLSLYFSTHGAVTTDPHLEPVITSNGGDVEGLVQVVSGTTYVTTITVTNVDSAIVFSISGGVDASFFTINGTTGLLTFTSAPDFSNPQDAGGDNEYLVEVRATSAFGLFDTQLLKVRVVSSVVNTLPAITSFGGVSEALIDHKEGLTTVVSFSAYDTNSPPQPIAYSKSGGADQAFFTLNASTGLLTFISAPAFASPNDADSDNIYEVLCRATNSLGGYAEQLIRVRVYEDPATTNTAPVIVSHGGGASANITVVEGNTLVGTVVATDLQNDPITYSKAGGADQALFSIGASSGVLEFNSAPEFNDPQDANGDNVYEVIVQASDGSLNDTQALSITIVETPLSEQDWTYPPSQIHEVAPVGPTVDLPAYLQTVELLGLETTLTRVSDRSVMNPNARGFKPYAWNRSIWTHDDNYLLIDNDNVQGHVLNGTSYEHLRAEGIRNRFPSPVSRYCYGMYQEAGVAAWGRYDPLDGTWTTLNTYSEYARFDTPNGGDMDNAGVKVAVVAQRVGGGGSDIITIEVATGNILSRYILQAGMFAYTHIRSVLMTQSGQYVLIGWDMSAGSHANQQGWVLHNASNMALIRIVLNEETWTGSDVGYNDAGEEVLVTRRPWGALETVRLSDSLRQEVLTPLNGVLDNYTISCRNTERPGYAYISTYRHEQTGYPLYREVFALKLDGSKQVERFSPAFFAQDLPPNESIFRRGYGVPNRSGTKILFGTDWFNSNVNAEIHAVVAAAKQPVAPVPGQVYVNGSVRTTRNTFASSYIDVELSAGSSGHTQIVIINTDPGVEVTSPSDFELRHTMDNKQRVYTRTLISSRPVESVRFVFDVVIGRSVAVAFASLNPVLGIVGQINGTMTGVATSPQYIVEQENTALFYVAASYEGRSINPQEGQGVSFIAQTSPLGSGQGPDLALGLKEGIGLGLQGAVLWNMNASDRSIGLVIAVAPGEGESEEIPRLAALWPFASTSPWNTPIGSNAEYSASGAAVTNAIRNVSTGVGMYATEHAVPVFRASLSDPICRVTVQAPDSTSPAGVVNVRIPSGAFTSLPTWDSGAYTDAIMVVIDPDGTTAHEFWRMENVGGNDWAALAYTPTPLGGSGIELVVGLEVSGHQIPGQLGWAVARTTGMSVIGGLIRSGELNTVIRHALSVSAPRGTLRTPYQWPASRSRWEYNPSGPVLPGALLALPKTINLNSLSLLPQEMVIAKALQDFGAYIVTDEPTWGIYMETQAGQEVSGIRSNKLAELWSLLCQITNNTASAVGGGGTPLAALPPPLVFTDSGTSVPNEIVLFDTSHTVDVDLFGTVNHDSGYFPAHVSSVSWYGGLNGTVSVNNRLISRSTAATMLQFMILNETKSSNWNNSDYYFEALDAYVASLPVGVKLIVNVGCNLSGSSVQSYEGNWTIPSISATRYRDAITRLINRHGAVLAGLELTNEPPVSLFGGTDTGNWMNAWAGSAALFAQQARVVKQTLTYLSSTVPVIGPNWVNLESWTTSALVTLFFQDSDGGLDAGFGTGSGQIYSNWIDVVGIHGSASDLVRFRTGLQETKTAMSSAGISHLPLWITRWTSDSNSGEEDTWEWFRRVVVCVSEGVEKFVHEDWTHLEYQASTNVAALNRARFNALSGWLLEDDLTRAVILTDGRVRVTRDDGVVITSGTLPSSIVLPVVGQGRNLQRHPFRNDDPWNTPITDAATWDTSSDGVTDLRSYRTVVATGASSYDRCFPKVYASPLDPVVTITFANGVTGTAQIRVPFNAQPSTPEWTGPGTSEAYLIVCDPDGLTIHEFGEFRWTNTAHTTAAAASYMRTQGNGWGVMYYGLGTLTPLLPNTFSSTWWNHPAGLGQISAAHYGGSIHGGLIQEGDLTNNLWGYIPHCLNVKLNVDMIDGDILNPEWPASRQDGNTDSRGEIKIAALFGIPDSVDVEALSLSAPGRILARTLQRYGAYVTGVGAPVGGGEPGTLFQIDGNASASEKIALLTAISDYQSTLRPLLAICTNNTPLSQKGGGVPLVNMNADEHYLVEDVEDPVPPGLYSVTRKFFGISQWFQPFYWTGGLPDARAYDYAKYHSSSPNLSRFTSLNGVVDNDNDFTTMDQWVFMNQSRGHKVQIGALVRKAIEDRTLETAKELLVAAHNRYSENIGSWFLRKLVNQLLPDPENLDIGWVGSVSVAVGSGGWVTLAKTTSDANEYRTSSIGSRTGAGAYLAFRAGTSTTIDFGFWDETNNAWGTNANSEAEIVSGPGVLVRTNGALFTVTGLSTFETTWVRTRRRNTNAVVFALDFYPGGYTSTTSGASVLTRHPVVTNGYEFPLAYSVYRTQKPVVISDHQFHARWRGETQASATDANGWVTLTRGAPWGDTTRVVDVDRRVNGVYGYVELLAGTTNTVDIMVVNKATSTWEPVNRVLGNLINDVQNGQAATWVNNSSWWRVSNLHATEPAILRFGAWAEEGTLRDYEVHIVPGGFSAGAASATDSIKAREFILIGDKDPGQYIHHDRRVPDWALGDSELVSNPSFAAGLTSWTVTGASGANGVFPQVSGGVRIQATTANPVTLSQSAVMTVGKKYALSWARQSGGGNLRVIGSDTRLSVDAADWTVSFRASTTDLRITTKGEVNTFLHTVSLREVQDDGYCSPYDYYAQYLRMVKKSVPLVDAVGPEVDDVDAESKRELLAYLNATDKWNHTAGSRLDYIAFGTGLDVPSLEEGYDTALASLVSDLTSEGYGSKKLALSRFWITRPDTPQWGASQANVRRWYVLALMAAIKNGVDQFTFYEFGSDSVTSPWDNVSSEGEVAREWLNLVNQWWQGDLISNITITGDGSARAVRQDGKELIVLSTGVTLPDYDPETIERFFTLEGWIKSTSGSNADIVVASGGGILAEDALNFSTLAGAGSTATIRRNVTWNMSPHDGFWLMHRVNRRMSVGLTITLSNSVDLGANRWTASDALWSNAVGLGATWVPRSAFTVANGSPDWDDDIRSYSFQVASHATHVRSYELLGIVHRKEPATVVFTNDGGYSSVATVALPLAIARNIPMSHFLSPTVLDTGDHLTYAQAQSLYDAGHELGVTGEASWAADLSRLEDDLEAASLLGVETRCVAYPLGDVGANDEWEEVVQALVDANVVGARLIGSNNQPVLREFTDQRLVPSFVLNNTNNLASALSAVDRAIAAGGTIVFQGYQYGGSADATTWTSSDLEDLLDYVETKISDGELRALTFHEWVSGVPFPAGGTIVPPLDDTPEVVSEYDVRVDPDDAGGPLLEADISFERATSALVKDYRGYWLACESGELRFAGARRVDHEDATDYGWGALGIEYVTTDESDNPIPSNILRGILQEPQQTNVVLSCSDLTTGAWERRGDLASGGITTDSSEQVGGTFSQIRGMTGPGSSDVYSWYTGLPNSTRFEPKFLIRRINNSEGGLAFNNSNGGEDGSWVIDMSQLPNNQWVEMTKEHPSVTLNYLHATTSTGVLGFHFYREWGSIALDFDVALVTAVQGEVASLSFIPNTSTSVAATRNADVLTVGNLSLLDGFTFVAAAEYTLDTAEDSVAFSLYDDSSPSDDHVEFVVPPAELTITENGSEVQHFDAANLTPGRYIVAFATRESDHYLRVNNEMHVGNNAGTAATNTDTLRLGATYTTAWKLLDQRLPNADILILMTEMNS